MSRCGTRHGYREDGCRCGMCRTAIAKEHAMYELRRIANGGDPLSLDKTGAVRRLQALMALGWPRRELARRAGYKGDAFALLLNSARGRVFLGTHERICRLYEELSMTLGPSERSRQIARERGWPPPLAWDDIDDPDETPDLDAVDDAPDPVVVDRILAGDWRLAANKAERAEVCRRWAADGRSLAELERRTGWKPERYYKVGEVAA